MKIEDNMAEGHPKPGLPARSVSGDALAADETLDRLQEESRRRDEAGVGMRPMSQMRAENEEYSKAYAAKSRFERRFGRGGSLLKKEDM